MITTKENKLIPVYQNAALIILLILAYYIRIYAATYTGMTHYTIDSRNYLIQAEILKNGGYEVYFPNGYPLIIMTLSWIFPGEAPLLFLNIILSVLTVLLVYLCAKNLTGSFTTAFICAVIVSVYPSQVNYVHFILTEVPSSFFLALSVYLFMKKKFELSGLSMGMAVIIRTTLILAPPLLFIFMLIHHERKEALRFFIYFMSIPLLLMSYGFLRTGSFTLGRNFTHNLYITINKPYHESYTKIQGITAYINYIINTPMEFLKGRIDSLWNLWGFSPADSDGYKGYFLFRTILGLRFPMLLLGIYGYIKSDRSVNYLILLLPAVSLTLVHMMFFSNTRFTVSAEPFLIILTVTAIAQFIRERKSKTN
jgi:4-amino-4-deoxy-L-arabinose transferase-like glycosyltransferase